MPGCRHQQLYIDLDVRSEEERNPMNFVYIYLLMVTLLNILRFQIQKCLDIKTVHALVKHMHAGPWYPAVRWSGNVIIFIYSF